MNFAKFLGTPFLQNTSGRLLLKSIKRVLTLKKWWGELTVPGILLKRYLEMLSQNMKRCFENSQEMLDD